MVSEIIHEIEHLMLPDSSLLLYWTMLIRLLSRGFESDNRPGRLLLNIADLKYKNNVHNRLFA